MTSRTLRVRGSADPDEVWRRYTEPARWSSWSPQINRVETGARRIAPGLTGTVIGPAGVRVGFTVLAVDEAARTWDWRAGVGPVTLHLHHAVAADPRGTVTTPRVSGPLPVVLGYLPVARFALTRLVRG